MEELEDKLEKLANGRVHYFKHTLSNNKDEFSLKYNSFIREFPYKIYWYDGLIQIGFEISKDGTSLKKYEFSSQIDVDEELFPTKFKSIEETIEFLEKEISKEMSVEV